MRKLGETPKLCLVEQSATIFNRDETNEKTTTHKKKINLKAWSEYDSSNPIQQWWYQQHWCWLKCSFTSTETVGLLGTGAQDGHLDFHTAHELCKHWLERQTKTSAATEEGGGAPGLHNRTDRHCSGLGLPGCVSHKRLVGWRGAGGRGSNKT